MNDEIKEILDRAKNLKYKCDCCEEIAPRKYVMRNDKQTDNLIEAVYIIDKLLDCITNLQEENQRLKEENKRIFSKVNDDELLISNAMNYAEAQEYKSRIDKAIELYRNCKEKDYCILSLKMYEILIGSDENE